MRRFGLNKTSKLVIPLALVGGLVTLMGAANLRKPANKIEAVISDSAEQHGGKFFQFLFRSRERQPPRVEPPPGATAGGKAKDSKPSAEKEPKGAEGGVGAGKDTSTRPSKSKGKGSKFTRNKSRTDEGVVAHASESDVNRSYKMKNRKSKKENPTAEQPVLLEDAMEKTNFLSLPSQFDQGQKMDLKSEFSARYTDKPRVNTGDDTPSATATGVSSLREPISRGKMIPGIGPSNCTYVPNPQKAGKHSSSSRYRPEGTLGRQSPKQVVGSEITLTSEPKKSSDTDFNVVVQLDRLMFVLLKLGLKTKKHLDSMDLNSEGHPGRKLFEQGKAARNESCQELRIMNGWDMQDIFDHIINEYQKLDKVSEGNPIEPIFVHHLSEYPEQNYLPLTILPDTAPTPVAQVSAPDLLSSTAAFIKIENSNEMDAVYEDGDTCLCAFNPKCESFGLDRFFFAPHEVAQDSRDLNDRRYFDGRVLVTCKDETIYIYIRDTKDNIWCIGPEECQVVRRDCTIPKGSSIWTYLDRNDDTEE